jgi:uncharacterized repeat protein (TIGR01451 family)
MKSRLGLARALIAVCGSCWLAPALAAVTLTTSVQKVERAVADDGTVSTKLVDAEKVVPGEEMRYTIVFRNDSAEPVDAGSVVITNPIPKDTVYIADSAFGSGTQITYAVDGAEHFAVPGELMVMRDGVEVPASSADYTAIRWTFTPTLAPDAQSYVSFNVRLK